MWPPCLSAASPQCRVERERTTRTPRTSRTTNLASLLSLTSLVSFRHGRASSGVGPTCGRPSAQDQSGDRDEEDHVDAEEAAHGAAEAREPAVVQGAIAPAEHEPQQGDIATQPPAGEGGRPP